jgi:hypothetical protein
MQMSAKDGNRSRYGNFWIDGFDAHPVVALGLSLLGAVATLISAKDLPH